MPRSTWMCESDVGRRRLPLRTKIVRSGNDMHYNGANQPRAGILMSYKTTAYAVPHFGTLHAVRKLNRPLLVATFLTV